MGQYAMTGDNKEYRVFADRRPHGAIGIGLADFGGNLLIARHPPKRDIQQGAPDSLLKRRAFKMQGERLRGGRKSR